MAWFEDVADRLGGSTGLGVGIAAVVLAPALAPLVGRGLRPVAKSAVKGYLLMTTRTRAAIAEAGDRLQDLYAEAKSEVETAGPEPGAAPAGS